MAGVILLASLALAGCGSARAPGGGSTGPGGQGSPSPVVGAAPSSVCADLAGLTSVRVARIPALSELDPPKPGLRRIITITVSDRGKTRTLASAVCGLPRMPYGVFHCPMNFGGSYQLRFFAAERRFPVVLVQAGGCEQVTGAGPTRWVARSPGFWTVLSQTTGIPNPRHLPYLP